MAKRCNVTKQESRSGHKISHSNIKTKRRFNVNMQPVSLTSDILGKTVQMRITMKALRSIDHNGGFDSFLLTTANSKLSDEAIKIKRRIRKALKEKEGKKAA